MVSLSLHKTSIQMLKPFFLFLLLNSTIFFAQNQKFTHQDTLRGSITKERVWWNLLYYNLKVKVDDKQKFISGSNTIKYEVLKKYRIMQIDLQNPMKIISITQNNKKLTYKKDGNAYFIKLKKRQKKGTINEITIHFEGNPLESTNPPWSGGFTWEKDKTGKSFIATSCQGIGASIWWPCKDHMYDEPDDGASLIITSPKDLMAISNGKLKSR